MGKVCCRCGKDFYVSPHRDATAKFCSLTCRRVSNGLVKPCSKCKAIKPLTAFHKRGERRFVSWCKTCAATGSRRRNQKGALLQRRYGLSLADYELRLRQQDYKCATCKRVLTRPHVDHNHATGKVRGLLCYPCNISIGLLKEAIPVLHNIINYLQLEGTDENI